MSDDGDGIQRSSNWNWKLIAAGVAALLALLFILQNRAQGKIYFLFFDVTVGVWVALVVAFVLGLVVGAFLPRLVRGRRD